MSKMKVGKKPAACDTIERMFDSTIERMIDTREPEFVKGLNELDRLLEQSKKRSCKSSNKMEAKKRILNRFYASKVTGLASGYDTPNLDERELLDEVEIMINEKVRKGSLSRIFDVVLDDLKDVLSSGDYIQEPAATRLKQKLHI